MTNLVSVVIPTFRRPDLLARCLDALLYRKFPDLYRSRIRRSPPWHYYAIVLALVATPSLWMAGWRFSSLLAAMAWLTLTTRFCTFRLRGAARDFRHVSEMIVTSMDVVGCGGLADAGRCVPAGAARLCMRPCRCTHGVAALADAALRRSDPPAAGPGHDRGAHRNRGRSAQ